MDRGAGDAPAAFAYDFNTLFDMIEGAIEGARAKWHIAVEIEDRQHVLEARSGKMVSTGWSGQRLRVKVENLDFDGAAAKLGEQLRERGLIP